MYLHHKYDKKNLLKVSAFAMKPAILAGFLVYTPFHILFIKIFFSVTVSPTIGSRFIYLFLEYFFTPSISIYFNDLSFIAPNFLKFNLASPKDI